MALKLIKKDGQYYSIDENTVIVGTTDKSLLEHKPLSTKELSIKNCQAIENGYDLDELVKDKSIRVNSDKSFPCIEFKNEVIEADAKLIKLGFELALSILGDKKFSDEDIRKAFNVGWIQRHNEEDSHYEVMEKVIQSLQKTEWDVEIVVDDTCCYGTCSEADYNVCADGCVNKKESEKNDAKRFLMLKRK